MNKWFDLYSCSWEYRDSFPDKFGRSGFYNTENKSIYSPTIAKDIYDKGFRPYYPDGKRFAVCVSHDIDHLYLHQSGPRKLLNAAKGFAKGRFQNGFDHLRMIANEKINSDFDLNNLIRLNNRYNIRSTYYFLSLEKGEEDYNYSLSKVNDQLQAVIKSNNEIGLHGGHKAFNSISKLSEEKRRLEEQTGIKAAGYRNHFLRFELPTTWKNLQETGFEYDTTLGYADCVGFRNGMCYPFFPFDVDSKRFLEIIELPLMIMDATLFYYMRLDADVAFKICKRMIDEVKQCQGVLTLLWHNNFMTGEMGTFYLRLLKYLGGEDPWFTTSEDLVKWWKEENLLKESTDRVRELINVP